MAEYKPGRTRNKSKNLPRQKYVIDLSEEDKICSNCGTKMVKVREIVSERIVHVPSSEYIEEVHRYVYECQNCLEDTYNWQGWFRFRSVLQILLPALQQIRTASEAVQLREPD